MQSEWFKKKVLVRVCEIKYGAVILIQFNMALRTIEQPKLSNLFFKLNTNYDVQVGS